jgi:hypothetical protein
VLVCYTTIQQSQWLQNSDEEEPLTLVSSREENLMEITEKSRRAKRNGVTVAYTDREVRANC